MKMNLDIQKMLADNSNILRSNAMLVMTIRFTTIFFHEL